MVRGPSNALTQVIRRLSEIEHANTDLSGQTEGYKLEHKDGPVPVTNGDLPQFKALFKNGFIVKTSKRDCCIKIGDEVVLIENFFVDGGTEYVAGRQFVCKEPFFAYPFDSRELGIYKVSQLAKSLKFFVMEEHVQKYVRLPFQNGFVVVPLLHSYRL